MELKNVKFGIELEMYGYYTDEQFINTVHRECEKRLLPVTIIDGNENDDIVPEGYWLLKGDSSIHVPKKGVATQVQQVGYRKGEQMFLPFGKMKHIEPETGIYDTERKTPDEVKGMIDQELSQKDLFDKVQESRIITNPDILAGDEKIKAYKVSRGAYDTQENQYNDFELVSPPLKFVDSNIRLIGELADVLKRMRMKVNPSTGLHVHVSFPEINLFTFIKIMRFIDENKIKDLWPTRFNKTYAKSKEEMKDEVEQYLENMVHKVKDGDNLNYAKINRLMPMATKIDDRYFGINIQSFEQHGTIEFRYAAGSLTSSEITEWVNYLRDLIDYCVKVKEVNNFLGRFDIKEEREGDIQIYDSRSKVTVKSENLIDRFVHQKNDIKTFIKQHNIENKDDIIKLMYNYLNKVGTIERKNVGNIFTNFIKFCNALLKENVFGVEEFSNDFFDMYANPSTVLGGKEENDDEEDDDEEDFWDDHPPEDIHEDTFTHILQQTSFKKMDSAKIANFINAQTQNFSGTESEHASEFIRSIVMNSNSSVLDKLSDETLLVTIESIQNSFGFEDVESKLYDFFRKIGSEKTKTVLANPKSGVNFIELETKFNYSTKILSNIIDFKTSKDFLINEFKKFIIHKDYIISDTNFFNSVAMFSDVIGADEMMSVISDANSFSEYIAVNLYNDIMKNGNASPETKKFVSAYVEKVSNEPNAKAFVKFANKHLHNEKVTAFDLYEALKSAVGESGRVDMMYVSTAKNDYSPALFNGRSFINKEDRQLIGVNKIDKFGHDDKLYSEEAKQYTIDLFKLLFKKYNTNKLHYIWEFAINGIDDFIKHEYMNNISKEDISVVVSKYVRLDYPLEEKYKLAPLLIKTLIEKSEDTKNYFIMQTFLQTVSGLRKPTSKICKLIKEVTDSIDTEKFAKTFKEENKPLYSKIEVYNEIMNSTAVQEIGLDQDLFNKEVKDLFKLNGDDEEEFNSLLTFLKDNYDMETNVYNGASKGVYQNLSDKDKLIVRFTLERNNELDDASKKQFLEYVKNDEDFSKKVVFAYGTMGFNYGLTPKGKTYKDSSFFVDVCFAMGKKINDNNLRSMLNPISSLRFDNSMRDNINYTKLSMLNEKIIENFMIINLSSITNSPLNNSSFWTNEYLLKPIYEKIIANKKLYKKLFESSNQILEHHLAMLFYYRKMKKMNLKIKSETSDDFKDSGLNIEFKINDKKYKIQTEIKDEMNKYVYDVSFIVDGKVVKNEKFSADGQTPDGEYGAFTYIRNAILDKPLNKAFNKYMDMKPLGMRINVTLRDIIMQGLKSVKLTNEKFEFKAPQKKKLNESVIVEHIDYHKEFKSIMIKKGVSEAKKFLIENKNNIDDRKLVAVMKQFGIR